jgi:hypothetical protein
MIRENKNKTIVEYLKDKKEYFAYHNRTCYVNAV